MPLRNKILKGTYNPPGDKSISHRIIILSSQAVGKSTISNLLESEDVLNTVKAMEQLGANIKKEKGKYIIYGVPFGGLFKPKRKLDFGNSGTGVRLLAGLLSSNNIISNLFGDKSLSSRPMGRITEHLKKIGTKFILKRNNFLPMKIIGSPNPIPLHYDIKIPSAQIKSAIMLSALNTIGKITIKEYASTRDHTERMLKSMGYNINFTVKGKFRNISMINNKNLKPLNYKVAGDPSSAAFMIVAASLKQKSKLLIKGMLYNPTRNGYLKTLKKMGANIKITNKRTLNNETIADILLDQRKTLKSVVINAKEIPQQIDEIPILSIAASFANGESVFKGLKELTVKESNRLDLIYQNLKNMGVECYIKGFDLHIIGENSFKRGGAKVIHHNDHRILMSFYIANIICLKNNIINERFCVKTSYPNFFKDFNSLLN